MSTNEIIPGIDGDAPIINDSGAGVGGVPIDMGKETWQRGAYFPDETAARKDRINKPGQKIVYALKDEVLFKRLVSYDENDEVDYRSQGLNFAPLHHIFSTKLHKTFEKEAISRFSSLITSNFDDEIKESMNQAMTYGFCVVSDEGKASSPNLRVLKNVFPFFNALDEVVYYSVTGLTGMDEEITNVVVTADGTYGVDKDNNLIDINPEDVGLEEFLVFERLFVVHTNNFEPIWADAFGSILRYDLNLEQSDTSLNRYQNAILQIRNLIKGLDSNQKQTEEELKQFYDDVHVMAFQMNRQVDGIYPPSPEAGYVQPNIDISSGMLFLEEVKSNIYEMLGIVRSEDLSGNQALDTVVIRTQEMLNRAKEYAKEFKDSYESITGLAGISFDVNSQVPIYGIIKELNGVTNISQEFMTRLIMTGYPEKDIKAELDRVLLTQRDELGMAGALRGVVDGNEES